MEFEDFFQISDHIRGQGLVGVEVISLRFALHLLSLVHLGVIVATAQGLQLTQDVLKATQCIVVLIRLWWVSIKRTHAKEGRHRTIFAERSVTLDWLILLQANPISETSRRWDRRINLLCGFTKKGMEEVRTTESPGNNWWNLTIRGIDVD